MHNFFTIEVETKSRRQDLEQSATADARAAQASPVESKSRWLSRMFQSPVPRTPLMPPSAPVGALLELPRVPRPVAC